MAAAAGEQTGETDPELLKVAISNEKGAPELLEYQEELVRRLQDKLRECETRVQALDQQKVRRDAGFVRCRWVFAYLSRALTDTRPGGRRRRWWARKGSCRGRCWTWSRRFAPRTWRG